MRGVRLCRHSPPAFCPAPSLVHGMKVPLDLVRSPSPLRRLTKLHPPPASGASPRIRSMRMMVEKAPKVDDARTGSSLSPFAASLKDEEDGDWGKWVALLG